jgi:subtilisin family serine protease
VVDDGLFKGNGEFGGKVKVDTTIPNSELANPLDEFGSHGTRVMNILAADSDNGGMTGIASEPLQDKLTVSMVNRKAFGNKAMGSLFAIKERINKGAKIVSCSWGDSQAHPSTAKAYRLYLEKMAHDHPDVLFVCSAGNDGAVLWPLQARRRSKALTTRAISSINPQT